MEPELQTHFTRKQQFTLPDDISGKEDKDAEDSTAFGNASSGDHAHREGQSQLCEHKGNPCTGTEEPLAEEPLAEEPLAEEPLKEESEWWNIKCQCGSDEFVMDCFCEANGYCQGCERYEAECCCDD
jgi:hypothetical protein